MNAIDKFKELVSSMTEHEREACLKVFSEIEHETVVLAKNIEGNIEKLKVAFTELSMENWDEFYCDLNNISKGIRQTWAMIDRRRRIEERARSAKRQEYAQGILDKGFKFDRIAIDGDSFVVVDGKLQSESLHDDLPF